MIRHALICSLVALLAGCGGHDRPTDSDWQIEWELHQAQVPTIDELLEGGAELCSELVGDIRVEFTALLPAPTQALDAAVDSWIDHAAAIVFDCSDDREELAGQYEVLALLAAEVDGGLVADQTR